LPQSSQRKNRQKAEQLESKIDELPENQRKPLSETSFSNKALFSAHKNRATRNPPLRCKISILEHTCREVSTSDEGV